MTTRRSEDQPSRNEDEYFAKQDAELIRQMRANLDKERDQEERKEEAHGDVHVDVCAECGGMWLDAGELELMRQMEKSSKTGLRGIFDMLPNRSAARK